jgi:hemoglobin
MRKSKAQYLTTLGSGIAPFFVVVCLDARIIMSEGGSMTEAASQVIQASIERIRPNMDTFSSTFYRALFAARPRLVGLLASEESRRAKLRSMLSTLANGRDLEKITPAIVRLGERHHGYGVTREDYQPLCHALMETVKRIDPQGGSEEVQHAWRETLDSFVALMTSQHQDRLPAVSARESETPVVDISLYDDVGGQDVVARVHQRFYETIFADPWLGQFFSTKSLSSLVLKQTRFMVAAFGGPDDYRWESPAMAHMHMLVTDEQADIREVLLRNAIRQEGLSRRVEDRWLAVDQAFRPAIVKKSVEECVLRCPGQMAVVAARPLGYRLPQLISRDEVA